MNTSNPFCFLRLRQSIVQRIWHTIIVCFLFFSLAGIQVSNAQIFQFMPQDQNYAAALAVAFAQDSAAEIDSEEKINLDENFAPADFGIDSVGTLPSSPFYFLKDMGRGITSFFTFDTTAKAKLRLQYASEKLLEAKTLAEQENASEADVQEALDNFKNELDRVEIRAERVAALGDAEKSLALGEDIMDSIVKYSKSLDKIEKDLGEESYTQIQEAKDKALVAFGAVGDLVTTENLPEKLTQILDDQKGSEFKHFKNAEVLKDLGEQAPQEMKEAIQLAEDNTLLKLQNELESLDSSQKAIFEDFVQEVGGNELRHLEIISDLEAQPISSELREAVVKAKEEALTRTEDRIASLSGEQQENFWKHLASGELEDVRMVNELQKSAKQETLQSIEGIKRSVTNSFIKKFDTIEQNDPENEKILDTVTRFHDAKSIAIFDEIDALIPEDKKGIFDEIKKRAAEEILKDFGRARNEEQRKIILDALAGDHPVELEALEWFKSDVNDTSYKNVFDTLAKTQFKAIQNHADQISDKDRLVKFEAEVKESEGVFKEGVFDWKSIFGSLDDKKRVFESPDRALEKVRAAEVVVVDFRDVANSLPLTAAYTDGSFDYTAQEIGRLLQLAERRIEMARTVLGYGDVGRSYSEASSAESIAQDGLRMAQGYKAGKKNIAPPPAFFLPTTVPGDTGSPKERSPDQQHSGMRLYNEYEFGQYCFYVSGFMKARMYCALNDGRVFDARGKTFPIEVPPELIPRFDTVTTVPKEGPRCPVLFALSPDFCSEGKIVYGMDERGCSMPPRCEARQATDSSICGGIAGLRCSSGYRCELPNTNFPDQSGTCIPETNTCQAHFTGFIYDTATQKCRAESASGCRDPFIYHDVVSCENAQSKQKLIGLCPGMPTVNFCPLGQKKVVSYSSSECGTYYACEMETVPGMVTFPYKFTNGYVVNDFTGAKEYCLKYPPGSGAGIAGECETKFGIGYGTIPVPVGSSWVRHFWKFSDGMTSESMILNRTDSEYTSFIGSVEAQCSKIPMNKFTWRPSAGNDSADNWKNFGIPDCSGTGTTAVMCGNNMCEMGETAQSCSQDCGGTGGGGTASTMKRCFYPNASQNGTKFGYSVWCEADYYNCHRETPTGTEIKTEGLSLGAPSSCESWNTSNGGICGYYTQAACDGDQMCKWGNSGCGSKTQCNDGIDNDTDGKIDYPADTGCSDNFGGTETYYGGYVDCTAYKSSSSCMGPQCRWDSVGTSCIATSGTSSDAPAAPTGLTATKVTGGIKLTWNSASQNVLKFKIFRKMNGVWSFQGEMGISSGTSGSVSYNDTSNPTGTIDYMVQACHATNCSMDSMPTSITVTMTTAGATQCSDNKDNDGDGWIDMGDSGCTGADDDSEIYVAPPITPPPTSPTPSPTPTTGAYQCSDGIDNDYDALIDYPNDTGCYSSTDSDEAYTTSTTPPPSSSMQRCFYPNAMINGTAPGYTVWCESDYYNCHQGSSSGATVSTSGLSLGAPSSCESGWTTGGSTSSSCSSTPSYCTTETQCTSYNFYWCNGSCVSNSSMCGSTSSSCAGNAASCTTSTQCAGSGYYWCSTAGYPSGCSYSPCSTSSSMSCNSNGICDSNESASSCPNDCGGTMSGTCANTPAYCYSQADCTSHAFYWCNNACYQTNATCPTP